MAEIIPKLNKATLDKMMVGERRLAQCLSKLLEDDYLVWYDIPIGQKNRYPDFIILHPSRGLLLLEVKDWTLAKIKEINKITVSYETSKGLKNLANPLEQARQITYSVVQRLERDPALIRQQGIFEGKLSMPYGWGAVFSNISRKEMNDAAGDLDIEGVLPDHLVLYKEDLSCTQEAEEFQKKLWDMFHYKFSSTLSLPQIDRIRWHLFPEIRIGSGIQENFFEDLDPKAEDSTLPDIIKIMDIQQEQLARSLGSGHRVIHGVSGSGKTLILGYRCLYLAEMMRKPILVLCFNVTLAAQLNSFIKARGIHERVQIYHFHDWCAEQIKTYNVTVVDSKGAYFDRQVKSVMGAVDKGQIPSAQYGAVLIDEGHDFEEEWLKLVVQMIDEESNSLLLLYDDAQSIYKSKRGLGFTLSSVGIQAQGRTNILRLNYRNTREILEFAYEFSKFYMQPKNADEDHIPLIKPEAVGKHGAKPVVKKFKTLKQEIKYAAACIVKWHNGGVDWRDIAVLYFNKRHGQQLQEELKVLGAPSLLCSNKAQKQKFDNSIDRVTLLSVHSSKGLEFSRVIMLGIGNMRCEDDEVEKNARLLYVGMTRAQDCLLLTMSGEKNTFSKQLSPLAS